MALWLLGQNDSLEAPGLGAPVRVVLPGDCGGRGEQLPCCLLLDLGSHPEQALVSSDGAAEGPDEVPAENAEELGEGLRGGAEGVRPLRMDLAAPVAEEESGESLPFSLESKRPGTGSGQPGLLWTWQFPLGWCLCSFSGWRREPDAAGGGAV